MASGLMIRPLADYELQTLQDDLNHDRPIDADTVRRLMDGDAFDDELKSIVECLEEEMSELKDESERLRKKNKDLKIELESKTAELDKIKSALEDLLDNRKKQ